MTVQIELKKFFVIIIGGGLCSCGGNTPKEDAFERSINDNYSNTTVYDNTTEDDDIIEYDTSTYTEEQSQTNNPTIPIDYYNSVNDYSMDYNNSANTVITCSGCGGSGLCTGCGGSCIMTSEAIYTDGHTIISDCPVCNGSGKCGVCYGTGIIQ